MLARGKATPTLPLRDAQNRLFHPQDPVAFALRHCGHAPVEDLGPVPESDRLTNLPLKKYVRNQAWLTISVVARTCSPGPSSSASMTNSPGPNRKRCATGSSPSPHAYPANGRCDLGR